MRKLLERQLKRAFGSLDRVPAGLDRFLELVESAYRSAEDERRLVERSLELMSAELFERNAQLRREVTDQKAAQAELRRQRQEFRALIEAVPDVILVRRGEHFVFVNQAAAQCLGYASADELAGAVAVELVHPDERAALQERMAKVDRGETAGGFEVRMLRKDGEIVVLEIPVTRPIEFEGAQAALVVGRDVTEHRKMKERLRIADRMVSVGTLAAGVAHEINNPLAFVLANLGYLAERFSEVAPLLPAGERDEFGEALDETRQGAKRVQVIVQDLKIFSRSDEDRVGPVDLRPVLESSISLAGNEIRHRARLETAFVPVPPVMGNAGRLGQVFVNLLVNAAQAIPEGAARRNLIRVELGTAPDGRVRVAVRDTGAGMTPEVQRRIFDPFFTTKPVGVGTGLGLAICHGIVRGMSGDIEVDSTPGAGTTFSVLLPPAEETVAPEAPRPAPVATQIRKRVLVVDDEELVGHSVRRTLRDHQVDSVTSAAQALARLRAGERFEVILCDLMMPEMTGMELHAAVVREWPAIAERMYFLTGGAFTHSARAFLDSLPERQLPKPFDTDRLRALVRAAPLLDGR